MQLHHHVHFQIEIARQRTCADRNKYVLIWPWAENKEVAPHAGAWIEIL